MSTRAVGPGRGIDWLKQALNLGRSNPKAIFGGAAMLLLGLFMLVIVAMVALTALTFLIKQEGAFTTVLSLLVAAALMTLMATLMVGYLRLLDAVENGRPARPVDVFAGLGDRTATLNAIGFMLLLMVVQNTLVFGVISVVAPEVGSWYLDSMRGSLSGVPQAPPVALPSGFGIAMVAMWVIGIFCYAVQSIGFGQIALNGGSIRTALVDGVAGAAKNLVPMLVLFLAVIGAAIVMALAFVLLALVVGVLVKLAGAWLLVAIGIPLYALVVVIMMVVMFGVMYYLWRDICADGTSAPPVLAEDRIEL